MIEREPYGLQGLSMTPTQTGVLSKGMPELANETINRPSFFDQLKRGKDKANNAVAFVPPKPPKQFESPNFQTAKSGATAMASDQLNSSFLSKPRVSIGSKTNKSPEEKAIIKKMQATEMNKKLKNYPKQQLAPFLLSNSNFTNLNLTNNGRATLKPLD